MKKVLVAVPTSKRHEYVIEEFLDRVRNLTHPVHLLLYDNTIDGGKYFKKLKDMTPEPWITVKRHTWNPNKTEATHMLANVREKMRKFFLLGNYSHYFDIATDFMLPPDIIQRFIAHDKDIVGAVTHMYVEEKKKPAIVKWHGSVKDSGFIINGHGLDIYEWKDIKHKKGVHRVWGCAVALMKRKVLKKCQFRSHPTLIIGEDIWFWAEVNEKGFEWWCDMDLRIEHKNVSWANVPKKRHGHLEFAIGSIDARGVDYVRAGKVDETTEIEPRELEHIKITN